MFKRLSPFAKNIAGSTNEHESYGKDFRGSSAPFVLQYPLLRARPSIIGKNATIPLALRISSLENALSPAVEYSEIVGATVKGGGEEMIVQAVTIGYEGGWKEEKVVFDSCPHPDRIS